MNLHQKKDLTGSKPKSMPRQQEKEPENRKKAYRKRKASQKVCPGGKKRSLKTGKRHTKREEIKKKYALAARREAEQERKKSCENKKIVM